MSKPVNTIADIAKLAGVSKSTVSRALNDNPLISPTTRKRIQAIARKNRYEIHQGARCLSLNRSQTIALIIPPARQKKKRVLDPFFLEFLQGIMMGLAKYGYDLMIGQPQQYELVELRRYIDSKRADGLILMGGCCEELEGLVAPAQVSLPLIVWGTDQYDTYCSVDCDNRRGARLAVQHLLQIGRRRIAYLGGYQNFAEAKLRYGSYVETLTQAGVATDPNLEGHGEYSSPAGYDLMQRLLKQAPDLDALFACSDLMAIGAMQALRESGRKVPGDVSVVGFDDISLAAHYTPPLTTIRQDIPTSGEVMVHNLMRFLKDGLVTRTILPVELIVRDSSVAAVEE